MGFRRQTTSILCFLLSTFYFLPSICFSQVISSTELIRDASYHDGKNVAYDGEIIGDIMQRGDFVWLNVNDGENAIGINCKKELIASLNLLAGGYNYRGDWVKITGSFNRACEIHGGDLDIHADKIQILKPGKTLKETVSPQKKGIAVKLIWVLLILLISKLLASRLRKRSALAEIPKS